METSGLLEYSHVLLAGMLIKDWWLKHAKRLVQCFKRNSCFFSPLQSSTQHDPSIPLRFPPSFKEL